MRRELLLHEEMIDAAEQAQLPLPTRPPKHRSDRRRREALLWNFSGLGEAAGYGRDHPIMADQLRSLHRRLDEP